MSLLEKMVECAKIEECINPAGSSRANHRQEQTVMNSLMCAGEMALGCEEVGGRFGSSSSFEADKGGGPWVESGAGFWGDVELFTRRVHPLKPYEELLQVQLK